MAKKVCFWSGTWAGTVYFQLGCIPKLPLEALAVTKLSWLSRGWQLKLVGSVAIVGTLLTAVGESVLAQIVPDNTLGAEGSIVTPDVNIQGIQGDRIDGGATRGANLFHSFQEFNVGEGSGAYFANPAGIENILTRVTGNNPSNILGRLGVLDDANLFLINPNGIVFGQDASLDVQGSFLATTADAVKLGDAGLFSASQPATSNLLSVSPSALWFNAVAAQPIVNRSQAPSLIGQPNSDGGSPGLQVQPGRTLALVGGDVLLEGGNLTAAGGRIELGSVAGVGEVSLSQSGNNFVLGYDSINDFGNIWLSNEALVDASGAGGGDVQIRGGQLELTQGSDIWVNTLGAGNGGQLSVTATERIEVRGLDAQGNSSSIRAQVSSGATGKGGNLTLETAQLSLSQGSFISVSTFGTGDAGQLNVNASEIELIGDNRISGTPSGLFAVVGSNATGKAGDVTIQTQSLRIIDGATLSTSTFGEGNAGNLRVTATERIEVSGSDPEGNPSGIRAQVDSGATGKGGNLTLETPQLSLNQGGQIAVSTFGTGDAGQLNVNATQIELIGDNPIDGSPSGLFANVVDKATGDGGDVTIFTQGLRILDGATLSASTFGEGDAGKLNVNATEIELIGTSRINGSPSNLFAAIGFFATGNGGDVTIQTQGLRIIDGAFLSVSTFGEGNAGNLSVTATERIEVSGLDPQGYSSSIGAQVSLVAIGKGGNLTLETPQLSLNQGGQIGVSTFGTGDAGALNVNATEIELIGTNPIDGSSSGLFADVGSNATGNGGDVTIQTQRLRIIDGATLSASTFGDGTAGDINIRVRDTLEANNGTIATSTTQSTGGSVKITAGDIRLFGDSDITTSVNSGAGGGGNIYLKAGSILAFDDSDILAFARDGRGGDVTLNTRAFFGENYRPAPRNTDPRTLNGNNRVDVNASGAVNGVITLPDTTFIQNSLTELPENQIDTDSLLANSCIVRRNQPTQGSFTITGTGGLPQRPGDAQMSSFPTVDIETLPSDSTPTTTNPNRPWQKGDPIVEPQGVYRLPNGRLVLSRECS